MKKFLTELVNFNWFFVALLTFVIVLPLSEALVSVFSVVVLLTAIIEDKWKNKLQRIKDRKVILLIPLVFGIYLISSVLQYQHNNSFYDVQKSVFYVIFPLAFSLGKSLTRRQKRYVFYVFSFSVLFAIIVSVIRWLTMPQDETFSVHNISFISHIRFSFQLILIIWFFTLLLFLNFKNSGSGFKVANIILILFYFAYLAFQQSLTGLIAFVSSGIFFLFYLFYHIKGEYRIPLLVGVLLLFVVPLVYVKQVIKNFYTFDQIELQQLPKATVYGNLYKHNIQNEMVENGHFVGLYICEEEMREEWNKISEYKYDSRGTNGYPVSATLIRYLTSKNLRKDAIGVQSLQTRDVRNIEHGMANYIFQNKYSLYPRMYQTVWEYYVYSKTGSSNHQSFSQRLDYAKAALTIIKKNPWFGVGTGKWKKEFEIAFKENQSKLKPVLYASSHNQYLNYMVKFGLAGFVLILFLLIYPIIKTKSYRDPLFVILLVFMFFANFADSNLESHMGSSFFFFFYCLFLFQPHNYLHIQTDRQSDDFK